MFIDFKNVNFSYGRRKVINNISFQAEKGEIIAIVGSSGSGKSTILRLLAGLLQQFSDKNGIIKISGYVPNEYKRQGKLAMMFQLPNLFPNLTVEENVGLPLEILSNHDPELISQMIQIVGLTKYRALLPHQLSGGMATRVSLARAFITKPELLLLDEPFSSLDVAWKDALYQELKELSSKYKTTTVLVTHDIEEAILLADKILCLSIKGKIIKEFKNSMSEELKSAVKNLIINDHSLKIEYEKVHRLYSQ